MRFNIYNTLRTEDVEGLGGVGWTLQLLEGIGRRVRASAWQDDGEKCFWVDAWPAKYQINKAKVEVWEDACRRIKQGDCKDKEEYKIQID